MFLLMPKPHAALSLALEHFGDFALVVFVAFLGSFALHVETSSSTVALVAIVAFATGFTSRTFFVRHALFSSFHSQLTGAFFVPLTVSQIDSLVAPLQVRRLFDFEVS